MLKTSANSHTHKMHVLILPSEHFLVEWSPLGGIFQLDLARGLRMSGNQVGVLSVGKFPGFKLWRQAKYKRFEEIGGLAVFRRYVECPLPHRLDRCMLLGHIYSRLACELYEEYKEKFGKPDIIHAHNLRYAGFIASKLSDYSGVPFVVTEHSSEYSSGWIQGRLSKILRGLAVRASGLSVVSKPFRNVICDVLKLNTKSVSVIPNILPRDFRNGFERAPDYVAGTDFLFINVAELVPIKNQELLIKAFAKAFCMQKARLLIVGEGPCKSNLLKLARDQGVADKVNFTGRVPRNTVRELMCNSHCFVLSSNSETFGVVLIEALSQGLPIVATSCGGPSDIVNQDNGILVEPGDIQSLSVAMSAMRYRRNQFDSRAISRKCCEQYGEVAVTNQYLKFFHDAI